VLCVMFTYHPTEPLPGRMREIFDHGAHGRQSGHPSVDAYEESRPARPYADYWPR
jgi:phthalate 4,5-dioxygenase oxygenase subunit